MMERVLSRWAVLICAVLLFTGADYTRAYSDDEVEVKGTVFALDNDGEGNVIAVSILDPAGNEYLVVHDHVGSQLLKMVDKNVKVNGVINVSNDGKKHIRVKRFEIFPT